MASPDQVLTVTKDIVKMECVASVAPLFQSGINASSRVDLVPCRTIITFVYSTPAMTSPSV